MSPILIARRSAGAEAVVAVAVFTICAVLCAGSEQPGSNFTHEFASKWITVTGFCEEFGAGDRAGASSASRCWSVLIDTSYWISAGEWAPSSCFMILTSIRRMQSVIWPRPPPTLHTNRQDLWFLWRWNFFVRCCLHFLCKLGLVQWLQDSKEVGHVSIFTPGAALCRLVTFSLSRYLILMRSHTCYLLSFARLLALDTF